MWVSLIMKSNQMIKSKWEAQHWIEEEKDGSIANGNAPHKALRSVTFPIPNSLIDLGINKESNPIFRNENVIVGWPLELRIHCIVCLKRVWIQWGFVSASKTTNPNPVGGSQVRFFFFNSRSLSLFLLTLKFNHQFQLFSFFFFFFPRINGHLCNFVRWKSQMLSVCFDLGKSN